MHSRQILLALGLLLTLPTQADEARLHFVGTTGISYGGDTLADIQFSDGDSEQVKAGSLFYLAGGPSLEFTGSPWSAQVMLGYQFDETRADNGKVKFDRTTVDAQLFYRIGDSRLGLGLVRHLSPEYRQSFDGMVDTADFDNATGLSLEYNWLPEGSAFGFSVRGVLIDYDLKAINDVPAQSESISGDHVAAGLYVHL